MISFTYRKTWDSEIGFATNNSSELMADGSTFVLSSRGAKDEHDKTNNIAKNMRIFIFMNFIMPLLTLKYTFT